MPLKLWKRYGGKSKAEIIEALPQSEVKSQISDEL